MKRRTFIEIVGAMGVLGPEIPGSSLAQSIPASPETLRPLIPVFDRLCGVGAGDNQAAHENGLDRFPPMSLEELEGVNRPLLIGLGEAAETLVNQAWACGMAPADAGLYRTGIARKELPANTADAFRLRLSECAVTVLLIDAQDMRALSEGLVWARQLAEHEVYLRVALLLNTTDASLIRGWRAAVGKSLHKVLEVRTSEGTLSPAASVHALLYGLPFMTRGLVCYDIADLRHVLTMGTLAGRTTAVGWNQPDALSMAIGNACELLAPMQKGGGALAFLHGGWDLTLADYDAVGCALRARLAELSAFIHIPRPEWTAQRRIVTLTTVGDSLEDPPLGEA